MAQVTSFRPHCHAAPSDHFMSCAESHCCKDAHWFGCFRRPNRDIAQCLPLSHQSVNGTCTDSEQWLCPETWLQPPPPPSPPSPLPPPSPAMPPSLPPMPPDAEPWHRCHAEPSDHFAGCLESRCCKDPKRYGCFHKRHKAWAACMPLAAHTPAGQIRCVDNDEWLCPSSWLQESPPPSPSPPPPPPFHARCAHGTSPSAHYASCLESHCCADSHGYACFKRPNKHFAQCLPLSHMLQADGSCVDTPEWLCPSSWLEPPPPPAAPSPPPLIEGCVGQVPSANYASCLESRTRPPHATGTRTPACAICTETARMKTRMCHHCQCSPTFALARARAGRLLQRPSALWLL